jgi:hypothetical protein
VPGPVSGPNRAVPVQGGADPAPHGESGLIVVGWLGLSHHEGAGVAPQPAARAVRIGRWSVAAMANVPVTLLGSSEWR